MKSAIPSLSLFSTLCLASCGNFDFSNWDLQLPIGSKGSPETISATQLDACYSNSDYFYIPTSGSSLVLKVPGSPDSSGCVTTANSQHCRTELRETQPASWDPSAATNRLTVDLKVVQADDSKYGTVIGQIHMTGTPPLLELYYAKDGSITAGVQQSRSQGTQKEGILVGNVPLGQRFTYMIAYENGSLKVTVANKTTTLDVQQLDNPESYFKVGNYNQGDSPSEVHVFSFQAQH
jgi:Alginate lyase